MDTLPLELHSQIFEYACVDDGTTARSLSLVSRYVRHVSEPFRYQSLAVAGLASLTQLVNKLESLPTHRRRVRHLFLSDWTQKQVHEKAIPSDDADMDRYDLEKSTITHILDLVASTLETFAFVSACPFNSSSLVGYLFSLHFPCLRDLAVHGFYPFPHSPDRMPSLEHLHLSGNRNPHGLLQSGGLSSSCPKLRELRISGLVSAPAFADEIQSAVVSGEGHPPQTFTPKLPPRLRKIVLDIGPRPSSSRRYAATFAQHEKMLDVLNALKGRTESTTDIVVDVEVVEAATSVYPYEMLRNSSRKWQ